MLPTSTTDTAPLNEPVGGNLTPEIQGALQALSEVEARFKSDRECLAEWNGPDATRERLLDLLEARHKQDREPLVRQLADLYQRLTSAAMLRSLQAGGSTSAIG
jgi:hypothetical protein